MEYFTNEFLTGLISYLWILPAIATRNQTFPLKIYFRIFAIRNILVELLLYFGFYYQNTVYHISELMMMAIILNPNNKIVYLKHSYIWFYFVSVAFLIFHLISFYMLKFYELETYSSMVMSLLQTLLLLLATQQKLKYRLTLNYYTFILLMFFFFNFLRMTLHVLEYYRMSYIFNLIDLIPIAYFSIANYEKSKAIFKFT
jgi:hypothetical protein